MSSDSHVLGKPERFLYGVLAFAIFVGGCIFLLINSYILGSGASRNAYSDNEKYAFALAAGMVPWFIAVMPLLIQNTWHKWGPIKIPSVGTAAIIGVWTVFIAYNLMGGSGAIATERTAVVSSKEHANSTFAADKERRLALLEEAKGIPQSRPAQAVEAMIAGEKVKRMWELSGSCSDPKTKMQRAYCLNIQALEAEAASGTRRNEIQTEVAKLDAKIAATSDTVGGSADPQAEMLYAFSCTFGCWSKESIALWLPAATPIVLEIGASTSWYFAGLAFGIAFARRAPPRKGAKHASGAEADVAPAILVTKDRMTENALLTQHELQDRRRVTDEFFARVATPSPGSSMSEREWYGHYKHYCRLLNAEPLPLDLFRRIAGKYVDNIETVEGQRIYMGTLPVLDKALRQELPKLAAE